MRDKRLTILALCVGIVWGSLIVLFRLFVESAEFGIMRWIIDGIESSLICGLVAYGLLRAPALKNLDNVEMALRGVVWGWRRREPPEIKA
jgi:hypothetical protein